MAILRSILILAVAVVLASCQTLTAPPGFASAGSGTAGRIEFPDGVSLEAQYSLLDWYVEEHGAVANRQAAEAYGVALNARNERGAVLRGNGARSLVQSYPDFAYVPRQGGIAFQYKSLGKRLDFAEMDAMLAACQEELLLPHSVEVPVEECVAFLSSYADSKELALFQSWASRNGTLELGGQDAGALKMVRLCREALIMKSIVCGGVSSARELIQEGGHDSKALDILDDVAKRVGVTHDFGVIGDYETLQDFRNMSVEAPLECVNRVLRQCAYEPEKINRCEFDLSSSLESWSKDLRFQPVVMQKDDRIREVVSKMLDTRIAMIEEIPQASCASGAYWTMYSWANERIDSLQSGEAGSWSCYVRYGFAEKLLVALNTAVEQLRGPAIEYYLQVQGEMSVREDRQAVVVALHELLKDLGAGKEVLAISGERNADALSSLGRREAFCPLFVEDFSSEVDWVSGRVWSSDLRQALSKEIARSNAGLLCCVSDDSSSLDALRLSGDILDFSSGEEEVRTETKTHRWYNEARLEDSTQGVVFVQDLFEETILSRVYSRTGYVRVRTKINWEDSGDSWEEVLTVSHPKEFVQEEVVSTEKIRSVRCDDERQTMAPGSPATLRKDRLWSEGEMLDFCRQDILNVWVEWILCKVFPAKCDALSTENDDLLEVAERLGEGLYAWKQCQFPEGSSLEAVRQGYLTDDIVQVSQVFQGTWPEVIRHFVTFGLKKKAPEEF